MLETSATWLSGKLKDHAGTSVAYKRASSSVSVTATLNVTDTDVADEEGFATVLRLYTWTFTAADLVIGGNQIEPRRGDVIEQTVNGSAVRYEVVPEQESDTAWQPLDGGGIMIQVRTKKIA